MFHGFFFFIVYVRLKNSDTDQSSDGLDFIQPFNAVLTKKCVLSYNIIIS